MAVSLYPPNPAKIPKDLTEPGWGYCSQVLLVLASLILFVALYFGLLAGSAYLFYSSFKAIKAPLASSSKRTQSQYLYTQQGARAVRNPAPQLLFLHIGAMVMSSLVFLFLVKGFFKFRYNRARQPVEIDEASQPQFYAFLRQLCHDTGAAMPHRVFLVPEVNAAVTYDNPLRSLILPTPKNLVIGLGLVNHLNLTEFKAVLAHEFGHFAQNSMKLGTYVYQVNNIIGDIVYGRDWFDDMIARMRQTDHRLAIFGHVFFGIQWTLRMALAGLFRAINFANSALARQMEFNADLVAVTVVGSDAIVHALARLEHADDALAQALRDLTAAGDHKLYSRDLFHHQTKAAEYLKSKDPKFGALPALPSDETQTSKVFKPGDTGVPLMWATHPSNFDRERNVKREYVRGVIDERSPWELFCDATSLREKVTRRFHQVATHLPPENLADAEKVQAFIDAEHAETTYPARFQGMYDDRYLELMELDQWREIPAELHEPEILRQRHFELYGDKIKVWLKQTKEHQEDYDILKGLQSGKFSIQGKSFKFRGKEYGAWDVLDLVDLVDKELAEDRKRFGSEDQAVFQVHYAMTGDVDKARAEELVSRYRFHAGTQEVLRRTAPMLPDVDKALEDLAGQREVSEEYFRNVVQFFQGVHGGLKSALDDASRLQIPKLENMKEGQPLSEFLLPEPLAACLSETTRTLNGKWLDRMRKQVAEIADRARRIHFKSLGGIFALQDRIAITWHEKNWEGDAREGEAREGEAPAEPGPSAAVGSAGASPSLAAQSRISPSQMEPERVVMHAS